jgi:hypothetical protein
MAYWPLRGFCRKSWQRPLEASSAVMMTRSRPAAFASRSRGRTGSCQRVSRDDSVLRSFPTQESTLLARGDGVTLISPNGGLCHEAVFVA